MVMYEGGWSGVRYSHTNAVGVMVMHEGGGGGGGGVGGTAIDQLA